MRELFRRRKEREGEAMRDLIRNGSFGAAAIKFYRMQQEQRKAVKTKMAGNKSVDDFACVRISRQEGHASF